MSEIPKNSKSVFYILDLSVYTGCRMGFYEWMRDNIFGKNDNDVYPFWYDFFSRRMTLATIE